jgi:hypothetical protein
MEKPSRLVKGIPQKPTSKDITEELNNIKKVTEREEARQRNEAIELGLTSWEYEKYLDFNKLMSGWEIENNQEPKSRYEIPENTTVTNNTKIETLSSHLILSRILKLASVSSFYLQKKYEVYDALLDNLSDVTRIDIKDIKDTDKLQFDVYVIKRNVRGTSFQSISFILDSKGRISLHKKI